MTMKPIYYTGIYFLLRDGVVVYIGKTTRFPLRLAYHERQHLPFDSVHFIQCDEDLLDLYERRWIKWFKPECNTTHKPAERPKKKITNTLFKFKRPMKFRKLSKKSFLGFGPHRDATVEQMFKSGKQLDLVKIYYSLSHISFLDDVLTELGVTADWQIEKPGTNPDRFFEFGNTHCPEVMQKRRDNWRKHEYKQAKAYLKTLGSQNASKAYHRIFNQKP